MSSIFREIETEQLIHVTGAGARRLASGGTFNNAGSEMIMKLLTELTTALKEMKSGSQDMMSQFMPMMLKMMEFMGPGGAKAAPAPAAAPEAAKEAPKA